jgi:uncharacterized protein YmfQ (DUF2313 family)
MAQTRFAGASSLWALTKGVSRNSRGIFVGAGSLSVDAPLKSLPEIPVARNPLLGDRHMRRSGDDYVSPFFSLLPQGLAWPRDPTSTLGKTVTGLAQTWGYVDNRAAELLEHESDPRQTIELLPDWEENFGLPDECVAEPISISDRQKTLVMWMTMEGAQSRQFFSDALARIGYTIAPEEIREWSPFMVGISNVGDTRPLGPYTGVSESTITVGTGAKTFTMIGPNLPYVAGDILRVTAQDNLYIWMQGAVTSYIGQTLILNVTDISTVAGSSSWWRVENAVVAHRWEIGAPEMRFYWSVRVGGVRLTWFRCGWGGGQCGVDPHLRIAAATDLECLLQRWKPAHTEVLFDYTSLATPGPMAGTP